MKEQIEEMARVILETDILCHDCGESTDSYCAEAIAEALYNAGYRKKKEVIDEFVEMLLDKYDIWTDNDILEYNYVSKLARRVAEEMKGGAE